MTTKVSKKEIKCAVFDLDGTLLNTIKTINYYLNFALERHGLQSVSEVDTLAFVGDGAVKLIERALRRVGADESLFDSVFADYNAAYNSDPYYLTEPYEGVTELLDRLSAGGISLSVLSNKPNFATKAAVSHFFGNRFSLVLGARDGVPLKPAPEALLSMLDELNFRPEETAYIGDSEPDILTAKNASVALSVSVSWGFRTRDQLSRADASIIVDNPQQIEEALLR